jgi:hypothetical protein
LTTRAEDIKKAIEHTPVSERRATPFATSPPLGQEGFEPSPQNIGNSPVYINSLGIHSCLLVLHPSTSYYCVLVKVLG